MPGEILPPLLLREAAQARTWENLVLLRTHCRWQRSQARVTMKDTTGFKSWLCSALGQVPGSLLGFSCEMQPIIPILEGHWGE